MNFKDYIVTEAKKWEDMTPKEREASEKAKKEAEKMVAQGKTDLGLSSKSKAGKKRLRTIAAKKRGPSELDDDLKCDESKREEVEKEGPYVTSRKFKKVTNPAKKREMRAQNPPIERKDVPSVKDIKDREAKKRKESFRAAGRMAARSKFTN